MRCSTWTRLAVASATVIGLATAGLAAAPTASAQENPPAGQCPPGFALQEAVGGRFVTMDHNGDRWVCTMTVPAPSNRVVGVIVDDTIPLGVHLP